MPWTLIGNIRGPRGPKGDPGTPSDVEEPPVDPPVEEPLDPVEPTEPVDPEEPQEPVEEPVKDPPPAMGTGVHTEFDVIMGAIPNPYPQAGYKQPRAFISAEGAAYSAWARNRGSGKRAPVVFVTNLDTSGPGSLKDAIEQSGPRKVWPLAWGNIDSPKTLKASSDTYYTNVFRPGASKGLNLRNGVVTIDQGAAGGIVAPKGATDIVLRYFRSHAGATKEQVAGLLGSKGERWSTEGMNNFIANGDTERIMLDHCNFAFCGDQHTGSVGTDAFTLQHTWMQAPIDTHFHGKWFRDGTHHGMPVIFGYSDRDVGMHHNVISSGRERLPRIADMIAGAVFDGRCNYVYNPRGWGAHFLHAHRNPGDRPHINWSLNYWQPGPWTSGSIWLLLGANLKGHPEIWMARNTAEGFIKDSDDSWKTGIRYRDSKKADYYRATPHAVLPIREDVSSAAAREYNLKHGADRYVIDPDTFTLKDTRDAVVLRTEKDCRNGTGMKRGYDVADVYDPTYGYDQHFPSGSISKTEFFSAYYDPWATAHGYPEGEAGFNAFDSRTGLYHHDLYEAALTPHYPSL